MWNFLIAFGSAAVGFSVGGIFGNWVQGIVPALLLFPVAYVLLARRTGRKVEILMKQAFKELEAGRVAGSKRILESALVYGRWQFMLEQQVRTQMGAIEYMQRNYRAARPYLENAWSRNWQAVGMLAAIDLRDGRKEEALVRLEACHKYGKKDAVMWGLYTYACAQAGDLDRALSISNDALQALPDSKALKDLKSALANRKIKRFKWAKVFGAPWLQFFPEQASQKQMGGAQGGRGQGGFTPRR
jgi:tetratricopeptide (TPR) repeat protein